MADEKTQFLTKGIPQPTASPQEKAKVKAALDTIEAQIKMYTRVGSLAPSALSNQRIQLRSQLQALGE